MGRVYEAEHVVLARKVAIKLLRGDAQASADSLARFQQEALTASRIGAPQIVEVIDFASHVGAGGRAQTYMVMELLVGESLEDWLERPGTLAEGVALLAELCDGLAAAHGAGVVHRDIKPANVFVRPSASRAAQPVRVKILDFGIAKVTAGGLGDAGFQTQKGSLLGTPYYLAPERVLGEPLTPAADVYSVGVVLYELLTGDVPFVAESFMGVLARHVQTPPLDPRQAAPERGIPDGVAALCMRLLAKQPSVRGSADQVASELRALLVSEGEALARVETGPRANAMALGSDTNVLADSQPRVADTVPSMTGPMPIQPRSSARIGSWVLGAAIVAGLATGGVIVAATLADSSEPGEPSAGAATSAPLPAEPAEVRAPLELGEPSAPARQDSSSEAGLAGAGEASSVELGVPEPAVLPEPAVSKRSNSTKPKPAEPKPAEPKPTELEPTEPKPTEPKPTEDPSVPTIKDDVYD